MARKDRSFSGGDIVRIWCYNLSAEEQNEVFMFFLLIVPGLLLTEKQTKDILKKMEKILGKSPFSIFLRLLIPYVQYIRKWINDIWATLIFSNHKTRKEVTRCITERLKIISSSPSDPPLPES